MLKIGLIREGKIPADNRVALIPAQCRWMLKNVDCSITVQPSPNRCFKDKEFIRAGVEMNDDLSHCDLLLGIKEVPVDMLIAGKKYMFFSHTIKMQAHNKKLMQAMVQKNISLIDYECLRHKDGQRIIGFGFFAGVVGAHNGMMSFGERTKTFSMGRVYKQKDYSKLIKSDIADIKNIGGGRRAGTIVGAVFIQEFIKDAKWAHLDIAGTAWKSGAEKGATGRPVALLSHFLLRRAA